MRTLSLMVLFAGIGFAVVWYFLSAAEKGAARTAESAQPAEPSAGSQAEPAWYEVLGVPETATREEIRQAWRALMAQYHPDKVASAAPEIQALAHRRSQEINAAYDYIMSWRGADGSNGRKG